MLRKLLILGVCAGASASVPILYQSNPDGFHALLKQAAGESSEGPKTKPRIVQTSAPASKAATVQLQGKKVLVNADNRGHFIADFRINGSNTKAMVDTGATLVAINRSTTRRAGISLSQADFKYEVQTANGSTRAASVKIESLQIGRIFMPDVQAFVLDDSALSNTLIGLSFLSRLDSYSVEDGALILVQ